MLATSLRLVRSSIAVFVLVSLVPAQTPREPLRVLRAMEVAGVAAFDRDAIATALVGDAVTMQALQRAPDEETAAAVAERVRELHRRGGYAKAEARGEFVDGTLRITLTAGTRFRAGPVRCSGNTRVPTARIRDLLGATDRGRATWVEGKFPVVDAAIGRSVTTAVQNAYREVGRHGVRVKVDLVPAEDRLLLDVAIDDEGHDVRIQSLRLDGEEPAQRDAVMAAVPFVPGALATSAALATLQSQFESTGRYLSVALDLPAEVPAVLDPLPVTVEVRPGAPAVGTVPARDAEQLRRAIDTLLANVKKGVVVSVAAELAEEVTWGRLRLLPGTVTVHFGQAGIAVAVDRLQWGDAPAAKAMLHIVDDQLTFALGNRIGNWRFAGTVGLQFQITTNFSPTGEAEFRWGIGVSTNPGNEVAAIIHPATATHVLTRATEVRRDGDELTIRFGDTSLRIAADGEIVGQRVAVAADDLALTIALARTDLAELRPRPAAGGTRHDAAGLLLEGMIAIATDAFAAAGRDDARLPALMRGCVEAAGAASPEAPNPEPDVGVPSLAAAPSMQAMIATLAAMPAVQRQCQGRIVELSAAFGSLLQGDARVANASFRAMASDERQGPLSLAIAGKLQGLLGNDRAATAFRDLAAARWRFDAFYADAADLAGNLEFLRPWPARIGARWRAQPELRQLGDGLPAGEAGDLAAWQKGLEVLWAAGGEAYLREVLLGK